MSKPIAPLGISHASGFIPSEIEKEIDGKQEAHRRQVQFWWDSLTPSQKRNEWEKDKQLVFYIQKPE